MQLTSTAALLQDDSRDHPSLTIQYCMELSGHPSALPSPLNICQLQLLPASCSPQISDPGKSGHHAGLLEPARQPRTSGTMGSTDSRSIQNEPCRMYMRAMAPPCITACSSSCVRALAVNVSPDMSKSSGVPEPYIP